jgi:hypothetical protein
MVALSGKDATGVWAQLEVLLCQSRRIESLLDAPSPLIWTAHRSGLSAVELD